MENEKTQNENTTKTYTYEELCEPAIRERTSRAVFNSIIEDFYFKFPDNKTASFQSVKPSASNWNDSEIDPIKPFENALYSIPKVMGQKWLKDKQAQFNEAVLSLNGYHIAAFNIHFLSSITQEYKQKKKGLFDDLMAEELDLNTKTTATELVCLKALVKNSAVLRPIYKKALISINPEIKTLFLKASYRIGGA